MWILYEEDLILLWISRENFHPPELSQRSPTLLLDCSFPSIVFLHSAPRNNFGSASPNDGKDSLHPAGRPPGPSIFPPQSSSWPSSPSHSRPSQHSPPHPLLLVPPRAPSCWPSSPSFSKRIRRKKTAGPRNVPTARDSGGSTFWSRGTGMDARWTASML